MAASGGSFPSERRFFEVYRGSEVGKRMLEAIGVNGKPLGRYEWDEASGACWTPGKGSSYAELYGESRSIVVHRGTLRVTVGEDGRVVVAGSQRSWGWEPAMYGGGGEGAEAVAARLEGTLEAEGERQFGRRMGRLYRSLFSEAAQRGAGGEFVGE